MACQDLSRRRILAGASLLSTGAVMAPALAADLPVTPPQIEGPFYPRVDQADKDADLTQIEGRSGTALGEVVVIEGQVLTPDGEPIARAVVDVWQANAAGRYDHEADSNPAPVDPNFQGWAIMTTDEEGRFRFKTVKPGPYPISATWTRPPHIHFKVARRGFLEITTQMYFEGEPLNKIDRLLNRLPEAERPLLIAKRPESGGAYQFPVVLEPV